MVQESSASAPAVLIAGAGAIGSFYGAVLAHQGCAVDVISRSDHDVVSARGIHIHSASLGDLSFRPRQVLRSASDCRHPPDYLLVCTKVLDSLDPVAMIRPAVGPDTVIVLIQNGVEIEPPYASAFPDNDIISALAFVAVSRTGPAEVRHKAYGHLVLGHYPAGLGDAARRLSGLFEAGGVNCTLSDNVVSARWEKCVWNAAFNPASVAGGGLDTAAMLATDEGEKMIRRAMAEVCAVAAACSYPQRDGLIEDHIAGTRRMPPYKTSMALDFEQGREMEIEAILGNVVRAARRENVAVPTLETLYGLLNMIGATRDDSAGRG